MTSKPKIICTIGPGSNHPQMLERLKDRGASFFRINLSHTDEEDIEQRVKDLLGYDVPIILDTEGSQVRTGNREEITYQEGAPVKLHVQEAPCDQNSLFLKPAGVAHKLTEGDLISLDFNSSLLRVVNTNTIQEGFIECAVVIGGLVGGHKAVQVQSPTFSLPPFSKKDHEAFRVAKKYGIKHFTLSFMEAAEDVRVFKEAMPGVTAYAKIESKKGLDNFMKIAEVADGVLIDRGDMSSQVPLEKIPFIQKHIISKVREMNKEVFVATNTLEQMALGLKPSKAEVNDIINTLLDGATGIALTKETAVGKQPIETVNMLSLLIDQYKLVMAAEGDSVTEKIESSRYVTREDVPELLPSPHGGTLVNRFRPRYKDPLPEVAIDVTEETIMDCEQIAVGGFSPLEGFMKQEDFTGVVENMRLANGTVWPIPVVFSIEEGMKARVEQEKRITLRYNQKPYAILDVEEIYTPDKPAAAQKIFGTLDKEHPGVQSFLSLGEHFVGGKITLIARRESKLKLHELTPAQTRKVFSERGWSKVVGFHTRNVIHRSHEFVQLEGLRRSLCDGLFVHPVIGKKKQGDFASEAIIKTYEQMISDFYPKSKVVFATLATYSRYAGPREALFTALVRKNYGCSHFIVGRDHTGVKDFYGPKDSHNIFSAFDQKELGIAPVLFDSVYYSDLEGRYIHEPDFLTHPEEHKLHISGTKARELLQRGEQPPEWYMRPEISQTIINAIAQKIKVFV